MSKLHAVISCDNDGHGDAYTMGIYSKKRLARKKVLALAKIYYKETGSVDVEPYFRHNKKFKNTDFENIEWKDIRDFFKEDLKKSNELIFGIFTYRISSHIVDED